MPKASVAATTGYINNGGLVQLGANNTAENWDYITVPMPSQSWRILVEGDLPTDKDGVACSVSIFDGTIPLFSASGTWGTQGQSSATANKKNWRFKLKNGTDGNKMSVKIGRWPSMTSITCKGYDTDRTLMRDCMTTELWRGMHSYPSGFLAPISAYEYFDATDCGVHQDALFSTAGTPVEIWHNGTFLGLYVLRADNDPLAYLMDVNNTQHILVQPQHVAGVWSSPFDSTRWDFPSPNVVGYDTGDDMSKLNTDVNNAAARVVNWMVSCVAGETDFRSTYAQYLDLTSALDFIIITEWSMSFDSLENNFMFGSWNATATSGVWRFWPYDEDETFGIAWFLSSNGSISPSFGWVTDDASSNHSGSSQAPGIFKVIRENMRPELRARWAELRDSGRISDAAVRSFIDGFGAKISPDIMVQDLANWPMTAYDGNQQGAIKVAQSVGYLAQIAHDRMTWIDAQWGYSA